MLWNFKRGLPHAHILLTLVKLLTPADVDNFISAELPNKDTDPQAFQIVSKTMIHGPCGEANPYSPCFVGGECSKKYPKNFNTETLIDINGFANYRRRNDGRNATVRRQEIDNRWVVPYNRALLLKYNSHINVELCARTKDEVRQYLDCRYISAPEACWRVFEFDLQAQRPSVESLQFHLPNEQTVIFSDRDDLPTVLSMPGISTTMFTAWMMANNEFQDARLLKYVEFPTAWVWKAEEKIWDRRKRGRRIGRLYYAYPSSGERYYLRMLLNIVRGPLSFEDIQTVNGFLCPDFRSACNSLGLLEDDNEWHEALQEASIWASPHQLRHLFVSILTSCQVTNPL
ncbi:uncharacterized protein LOC143890447 [Tasmannia lanceolata]|uniref:uncharacterized protein LOC143890447 n=1 Tax=Tasmannia lanceolata TaxID=3420 RepID=UPI004064B6FE